MTEFHFLRPLWLLLLPAALFAAWRIGSGAGLMSGWRAVVDKALQPFVLSDGGAVIQRRWPLVAALSAAVVATLALAGPAWDRQPVPAFRSDEALVVAVDLSRSMDATDVTPSRLARARIKLLDLLGRRASGQTALVVFTANAFTVTPLTTDTRTIASLVNSLSTDIMPSQGSLIEVGLEKSAELLTQTGVTTGEILVITDAVASPASFEVAETLEGRGIAVSVLAVGTEEGGPIPALGGGFVTDDRGQVVVPQLNVDNLRRLAAAGGGRFARLSLGDADLDQLYPDDSAGRAAVGDGDGDGEREIEIWRDQGIWLCLALLPLVALGFRRGWVYVLVAALVVPVPEAEAFEWSDLWLRADQQGRRALQRDAPDEAAALFTDPEWLAVARFRAGQFDASAAALAGVDTPDAHYNRGNALAHAGKLAEAIDAYDAALALDADHEDAKFNRDLIAELLEQQQQQDGQAQSQEPQSGEGQQQEQGEGDQEQQAQSSAGQDNQGEPQASNEDQRGTDPGDAPEDGAAPEETDGENQQAGSEPLQAATLEDVEDWASEQAAEQWLRRIPQDPGGLLRRKFLYQYQQLGVDQDGNRIWPGDTAEPW